ncbi:MAG: hypothetical protein F4Y63_07995 [Chloroflexi bacterium]|nr:hypothetical protein [Chloroflexota bacterium]
MLAGVSVGVGVAVGGTGPRSLNTGTIASALALSSQLPVFGFHTTPLASDHPDMLPVKFPDWSERLIITLLAPASVGVPGVTRIAYVVEGERFTAVARVNLYHPVSNVSGCANVGLVKVPSSVSGTVLAGVSSLSFVE